MPVKGPSRLAGGVLTLRARNYLSENETLQDGDFRRLNGGSQNFLLVERSSSYQVGGFVH